MGITDDSNTELNEGFTLTINSAPNAQFAGGVSTITAKGTVIDNDTASPLTS